VHRARNLIYHWKQRGDGTQCTPGAVQLPQSIFGLPCGTTERPRCGAPQQNSYSASSLLRPLLFCDRRHLWAWSLPSLGQDGVLSLRTGHLQCRRWCPIRRLGRARVRSCYAIIHRQASSGGSSTHACPPHSTTSSAWPNKQQVSFVTYAQDSSTKQPMGSPCVAPHRPDPQHLLNAHLLVHAGVLLVYLFFLLF
jgi:hypothetical protein